MTILEAHDLAIGYAPSRRETIRIASGLNLSLRKGELVCLLGPNGAGKSTLIRTLSAMQKPLNGKVTLEGSNLHALNPRDLARKLSVVLTERVTVGILSAYALVSLGRYPYTDWTGKLAGRDHEVVRRSIEAVGAQDLAHRNVSELSDGERQKVMLARALAQEPSLMILDEITAFLDLPRRVDIMRILRQLAHDQGCTILLSTHDLDLALRSADRVWLMPKGGVLHAGAPEDLVLSGVFERAFASEGVDFDRASGSFRLHHRTIGDVEVTGDGEAAFWTVKAVERLGYRVGAGNVRVEVLIGNPVRWAVHRNGRADTASTMEEVTALIRQ